MLLYKIFNSTSPLNANATVWALENIDKFPTEDINLRMMDFEMNKKISMDDLNDQKIDSSLEKLKDKEKIIEQKQARIATNDDDSSPKSKYRSILILFS